MNSGIFPYLLRDVDHLEPRGPHDFARVGLELSGDDLEKRGLSLAVPSRQGGAKTLVDGKRDPVEDLRTSEGQGDVL